jgi:hypothetical protein
VITIIWRALAEGRSADWVEADPWGAGRMMAERRRRAEDRCVLPTEGRRRVEVRCVLPMGRRRRAEVRCVLLMERRRRAEVRCALLTEVHRRAEVPSLVASARPLTAEVAVAAEVGPLGAVHRLAADVVP